MIRIFHQTILLLVGLLVAAPAPAADEWTFDGVDRVVAISDIHGAFGAMVRTLQQANVLDERRAWAGGTTHLVIVGDILDRGPGSRQSMDLLMKLEDEAAAAGGRVHVVVGNHEAMNLIGDMRYVHRGEYAAFSAEEDEAERDRWYQALVARDGEAAESREAFDKAFPSGFFAHRRAFAADGVYGAWLLEKPLIVVINGTAYVHGGVSPFVAEFGLAGINGTLFGEMAEYVRLLPSLYETGVVLPTDNFYDVPKLIKDAQAGAASLAEGVAMTEGLSADLELLQRGVELNESRVHDSIGPMWYRGNVACSALIETDRLDASLAAIGAERVVIGHTPTPTRRILVRLEGRVIEVDTGMNAGYYKGSGNALVIEGDRVYAINQTGEVQDSVDTHPRQVGSRPGGFLGLEETLAILADGEVTGTRVDETGTEILTLSLGDRSLEAVFMRGPKKGVHPELAAYELDLMLGLDNVPATVLREMKGRAGSLQFHIPDTINELQRSASGRGASAQCPLTDQWTAMYTWDALIHNEARTQQSMRYDRAQGYQLILTSHGMAFATKPGFPAYLQQIELSPTAAWKKRLEALTDEVIEAEFSDVLDKRRRKALGSRRDKLLGL